MAAAMYRGTITELTAPVANTTAGKWSVGIAKRPVIVANKTGAVVSVLVNRTEAEVKAATLPAASASAFTLQIADGAHVDVSFLGQLNVEYLSIWVPTGGDVSLLKLTVFHG